MRLNGTEDNSRCTGKSNHLVKQWTLQRFLLSVVTLALLLLIINQLLSHVGLRNSLDTMFLSQVLLVLIVSPYFSSRALANQFNFTSSDELVTLSPIRSTPTLCPIVAGSQVTLIFYLVVSTLAMVLFNESSRDVPFPKLLSYYGVLLATVFSSSLIGVLGWRFFLHRDSRCSICIRRFTANDRRRFHVIAAESIPWHFNGPWSFFSYSCVPVHQPACRGVPDT